MPTQTLECQISTVLMKRFLDGDSLPQELLEGLEQHLKACPGCQKVVNSEKQSIEEYLDGSKEATGLWQKVTKKVAPPKPAPVQTPANALLGSTTVTVSDTPPGLAVFKNPKVLILSISLAVVLVVMSTVLKNPMALLGPKAQATNASDQDEKPANTENESALEEENVTKKSNSTTESPTETDDPNTGATPERSEQSGDTTETDSQETQLNDNNPKTPDKPTLNRGDLIIVGGDSSTKKTAEDKPKPPVSSPKPKASTSPRKPATKRKTTKSSGSGIKVYDSNGNPIKN